MKPIFFDPKTDITDPEDLKFWTDFEKQASEATKKAVDAWEEWLEAWDGSAPVPEFTHKFAQPIWTGLKQWLREKKFNNHCAYCESTLKKDRYKGDAEHYRPKGNVTMRNSSKKKVPVGVTLWDGRKLNHPGYFWLAYDWRNLIPACSFCNSGGAKVDQFPAENDCVLMVRLTESQIDDLLQPPRKSLKFDGLYYLAPADLDARELPQLICPLNPKAEDEPLKHLVFSVDGQIDFLTPKGEHTINVLDLKRKDLIDDRCEAIEFARDKYHRAVNQLLLSEDGVDYVDIAIAPYLSGAKEYSLATLVVLERLSQKLGRPFPAFGSR